jgi:hypothetical protein
MLEMNPKVPSLPIRRCLMISIGLSGGKSTRAFKLYPVVHLMENLERKRLSMYDRFTNVEAHSLTFVGCGVSGRDWTALLERGL